MTAPTLGPGAARDVVAEAVREASRTGKPLADVLAARTGVDVATLVSGALDVGEAGALVDAALAKHRRWRGAP